MIDPVEYGLNVDAKVHMWPPFAIWRDEQTALMFYSHHVTDATGTRTEASIRVLESNDPKLELWKPAAYPQFQDTNKVFAEKVVRDPAILWDKRQRVFLMYYVACIGLEDREEDNVVRARHSPDLLSWSEPTTVMLPPPGYRAAESIFVLKRDGLYYLWVCGFDYGRMSLYVSEDPFSFGHPVKNRIFEQSGHAPEIVHVGDDDWMACVAIASTFGNEPGKHDLPGVYVQRLQWVEADSAAIAKIVRK
jgi:hypothetical protein